MILNQAQTVAVNAPLGPVLVIAGAGSGKTRVLTERITKLVNEHKADPKSIVAVTFTNKAASEMRERLHTSLGETAKEVVLGTFHSVCLRMLRNYAPSVGFPTNFIIYDSDDSKSLMKQILKEMGSKAEKINPSGVLKEIDRAKNDCIGPIEFKNKSVVIEIDEDNSSPLNIRGNRQESDSAEIVKEAYVLYQEKLLQIGAMDFGDLLMKAVELLDKNPNIQKLYRDHVKHILVDEFQDTNFAQYKLLKLLSAPPHSLFAVGDEDQSIYAFRGAEIQNILSFEDDFPGTQVYRLEQNYRSTGNILNAANGLISKNSHRRPKKLWTESETGSLVKIISCDDEGEEASRVVESILSYKSAGRSFKDCAIFYRTNAQSRALEESLIYSRIPYKIFGGLKFFERKEIKDMLAYLRLIQHPSDDISFARVINTPARGIGTTTIQKIRKEAKESGSSLFEAASKTSNPSVQKFVDFINKLRIDHLKTPVSIIIENILEGTTYVEKLTESADPQGGARKENISELIGMARRFSGSSESSSLHEFLDHIALVTSTDIPASESGGDDFVSLMTLHLAKGLEFPIVFFTGVEEGLCPHYLSQLDSEIEEERRLCYVGITRAKEELTLSFAAQRSLFGGFRSGGSQFRLPSRFLSDLPESCVEFEGDWNEKPSYTPDFEDFDPFSENIYRRKQKSGKNFQKAIPLLVTEGDKVRHKSFGEGKVINVQASFDDPTKQILTIRFEDFEEPMKLIGGTNKIEII